jgi:hypothetical protein
MEVKMENKYHSFGICVVLGLLTLCFSANITLAQSTDKCTYPYLSYFSGSKAVTGTVTISGYVKNVKGTGINNLWVQVISNTLEYGDGDDDAIIKETRTKKYNGKNGYYSLTVNNRGSEYGYVRVLSSNYQQNSRHEGLRWDAGSSYNYNITVTNVANRAAQVEYAGLRESYYGLTDPYFTVTHERNNPLGNANNMDTADHLNQAAEKFAEKVGNSAKAMHVLIVTQTEWRSFPEDADYKYTYNFIMPCRCDKSVFAPNMKYVYFSKSDLTDTQIRDFLSDTTHDVFIQIEPGNFDTSSSADKVEDVARLLRMMGHRLGVSAYPSIKGMGVDVEWYENVDPNGSAVSKVTTEAANKWESAVKGFNANLRLFLKHYDTAYLPAGANHSIIYVNDSQGFNNQAAQIEDFQNWIDSYSDRDFGFQIGYDTVGQPDLPRDRLWWDDYSDPLQAVPNALINGLTGLGGGRKISFIWVDFSLRDPLTFGTKYPLLTLRTPPPY